MDRRGLLGAATAGSVGALVAGSASTWLGLNQAQRTFRRLGRRSNNAGPLRTDDVGSLHMVWSVETDDPVVTLTFDDGPDPQFTPRVLDLLEATGVRATFNMVGRNIERHPDLARDVIAAGHEVGNHTWAHECLAELDGQQTLEQIRRGRDALLELGVGRVRWFRPPRGIITGLGCRYAAALGHDVLMWSVLGGSPGPQTAPEVEARLSEELAPGRIVALHDGIGKGAFDRDAEFARLLVARREAELDALPSVLRRATAQGMRFVPAGELVDGPGPSAA